MQQNINLRKALPAKPLYDFSFLFGIKVCAGFAALVLIFYLTLWWQQRGRDQQIATITDKEKTLQAAALRLANESVGQQGQKISKEHLSQQIEVKKKLIDALSKHEIGNSEGFSRYLMAFAAHSTGAVWLNHVQIDKGGYHFVVEGKSSDTQSILQYIQVINQEEAFKQMPFDLVQLGQPSKEKHFVAFKLTTAGTEQAAS